ncbi:helix-turn-helix transcriptional regulator [Mumia sp. Pv 4-285]|uniref:helix-turn-helix transcriptional regulator n=1 Tax=Mumia qirimensis TaxID=3234852 RepID=UPI00351D6479
MLLERESQLAALAEYLDEVRNGRGRMVLVNGPAGIGKSALVEHFASGSAARVLRGVCDGAVPARPMGPLTDIADALGPHIAEQLRGYPDVLMLNSAVLSALGEEPTILVVEDAHWADEATLDMLRYLGRRLRDAPVLILVTFRSDEIGPDHLLTLVLGDLASCATTVRLAVPALTRSAVEQWVREVGATVDVDVLFQRTEGNAFFIGELLAADTDRLPPGLRDAVLSRAARLSPPGRTVLDAVAVLGRSDADLVLATAATRPTGLEECLHGGLLVSTDRLVDFRHDLARQVIVDALSLATATDLAERALAWLDAHTCTDERLMATMAERARDADAILVHAPRAGRQAAQWGAHAEAAQHLRAAARHRSRLPDRDQAQLLEELSVECHLIGLLEEALECSRAALDLHRSAGDAPGVGVALRWCSRISWLMGRTREAHEYGNEAVRILEMIPAGEPLAMAFSNMSQLCMLAGDAAGAITWGRRAISLGTDVGADEVVMHAQTNIGTALSSSGHLDEGRALLEASLDRGLEDGAHEHTARTYNNLVTATLSDHLVVDARDYLAAGIGYCLKRDLDTWRLNMEAMAAEVDLITGDWDQALGRCRAVLETRGSSSGRATALLVLGTIGIRRGDPDATNHLDEALSLASRGRVPGVAVPVATVRAEAAWISDRPRSVQTEIDRAWQAAGETMNGWWIGALAWWSALSNGPRKASPVAPPFDLMLAGRWSEAATLWERTGDPFWHAITLAGSDDPAHARTAFELLVKLGASATLRAAAREWERRGVPVPRGRRPTPVESHGLTARELEVLHLLCEGLSNQEIAHALVLAPKTVGHHVSAVLQKLDAPSRARATARARQLGIVSPESEPPI